MHDARSVGVAGAGRSQLGQLGEAGQQSVDQGAAAVAGAVVDDQAGRLVHHDQVRILVHHGEHHPGVRPGTHVDRRGHVHPQCLADDERPAAGLDALSVHRHPALVHQLGHRAAGQAGEKSHGPVDAFAPQRGGDDGLERPSGDGDVAHGAAPPLASGTWRREMSRAALTAPITTQESATLNVGQKCRAMKSTTAP